MVSDVKKAVENVTELLRWIPQDDKILACFGDRKISSGDLRIILNQVNHLEIENATAFRLSAQMMKQVSDRADEIERLRGVLKAVHQDLIDRADPDGTVAVGASVWINLDDAVKGGGS